MSAWHSTMEHPLTEEEVARIKATWATFLAYASVLPRDATPTEMRLAITNLFERWYDVQDAIHSAYHAANLRAEPPRGLDAFSVEELEAALTIARSKS